ncbi:PTS sugar transporter subunit IIC [uncultured Lactobacillus sp.]|uniref:PTS sugar transporter subunit IIC n=1 Tax=uncultured Lactobacillus sp. TaxID=153152 RepID=UPI00262863AB|nr:PTS transporter subunit EIIC [uncultured Lactobacillus sp.]
MGKFNAAKITAKMSKLAGNRYFVAIRDGMAVIIPVAIVGSFFTIISQFPVDSWKKFITPYLPALQVPVTFSIGMMALYSCYAMAAALADHYKIDRNSSATIATMAFFILAVSPGTLTDKAAKLSGMVKGTVLPSTNFGAQGLFTAMLVSMLSVEIIRWFKERNLVIKMPDGVPPAVSNSFVSLIPASVIIILAWIIKEVLHFDLNAGLLSLLSPLSNFGKDNFISSIVPPFFNSLFWIFGIHGAITSTPIYPYWYKNLDANMAAIAHGVTAANAPKFMTEQFFQWFVYIGGSGTIIGLCILLAFMSKSSFGKTLGRAVIIPSIFNINEPIIFGLPIVLNPYFAIPFIVTPMLTGAITYFATVLHLVSRTIALVPWTLPGPIGAYMATGFDWRAAVLSCINIIISIVIYYPFFKVWDKKQFEKEQADLQVKAANSNTENTANDATTSKFAKVEDTESSGVTFFKGVEFKSLFRFNHFKRRESSLLRD